jgi:predicted flap endonuclease-1-like 5' DNA nuclease
MSHLILELIIWMLVAFFIGCLIGWLLRNLFAGKERPVERAATAAPAPAPPAPVMTPEPPAAPRPVIAAEPPTVLPTGRMARPRGIDAPRGGNPDDLQRISGIGPKNEKVLHNLGFYHFDQIAAWTEKQVTWVDDHLKFNGRIDREDWVRQASLLAEGKEEEFAELYGTGGVRDKSGEKKSGSRTRKR